MNKSKTRKRYKNKTNKTRKKINNKKNIDVKPNVYVLSGCTFFHLKTDIDVLRIDGYVKTGYQNESKRNLGINHIIEHMLVHSFQRCNDIKYNCKEYFNSKGIYVNAYTTSDYTKYTIYGINDKVTIMELIQYMIEILFKPNLSMWKNFIKRERNAVVNELLNNKMSPTYIIKNKINRELFNQEGLQYQNDVDIQVKTARTLSLSEIIDYYKCRYKPENVCISFTGNTKWNTISKMIVSNFTKLFNGYNSQSSMISPFFSQQQENIIVKPERTNYHIQNKNSTNTRLVFTYKTDKTYTIDNENMFSLLIHYLQHRLYNTLRIEKELIYSTSCYTRKPLSNYVFVTEISCEDKDSKKVEKEFKRVIYHDIKNGLDKGVFQGIIKKRKMNFYRYQHMNNQQLNEFYNKQIIHSHSREMQFQTPREKMKKYENKKMFTLLRTFLKDIIINETLFTMSKSSK